MPIDPFWGTVISTAGGLFGQKKGPPQQELLHVPPELGYEYLQQLMDLLKPGGGEWGAKRRALAEKKALDRIRGRSWAMRRDLMKRYAQTGQMGTPSMRGGLQRLALRRLGEESAAIRDIGLESMQQGWQGRMGALGLLAGMYNPRRIEQMRAEEQPGFQSYREKRWRWK